MTGWTIIRLAARSLWTRRITALLTILSIATAVLLFTAVENIRQGARLSFERTITGTDLIVGARSSPINLVLYSVFQIGDPTNNITWETYQQIKARPDVAWTVPISLGDSHRGYRVVGTTSDYFKHYKYGEDQPLSYANGLEFDDLFDVVLGAQVARELEYDLGTSIVLSHGLGATSFVDHADKPFKVVGILAPTGTPVDRSLYVSLEAIEAIHLGWQDGTPTPMSRMITQDRVRNLNLQPQTITAVLVGATSRVRTLRLQRDLNTYRQEPLQAVIPGVALSQLWNIVSVVERALAIISGFVVAVGLIGILTSILTSLKERRREMAILRSVGAKGRHIMALLVSEAALLAFIGATLGVVSLYALLGISQPILEGRFNIGAVRMFPGLYDLWIVLGVTGLSAMLGLIPAIIALRRSLSDGLSVRF
ncbi:MAG: FtsX-like permease family protein [Pseudomonadota bacterium]